MHMAIELNNRTKILAGVVVLALAGAGAWFFFLEDFLSEPPAKPPAVKSAPADAAKQAAATPAADAPKQADAAKPPAAAAKPGAKPIPENPDRLIAEVLENSGIKSQFQPFALEVVLQADMGGEVPGPAAAREIREAFDRIYEPGKINEELAANLKTNLDVERMGRFLELLRQPIALKMNSQETRGTPPEAVKATLESLRKNPMSPDRSKLLQALDDATRTTEVALEMSSAISRSMVDTMLAELQKRGKTVPKEASQTVASQLNMMRDQARPQVRSVLYATYRNASDEELAAYAKLIDTDTGRWGNEVLANAIRPLVASRGSALGVEAGKLAMARRGGAAAKAPAAPEPVAKMDEQKSAEKPAVASATPAAAPAAPPSYQRPANIREVYTRYNDVVSATVMRDRAAVKELLDDGKNPNARQSDGITPLMIAVSNGDADIATMLLAKGADPNLRAGGRSALSIAKSRGSAGAGLVQLLERSGAKN
jgi:hypothetical protein